MIIACHRLLTTNGKLGGFTGGTEIKRHLLNLETQAAIR
ncbi:MAG: MGMT family protein [Chloroflexi bacterium]|nr:MGMT family protein [Chloroflexota bacterium]